MIILMLMKTQAYIDLDFKSKSNVLFSKLQNLF